MIELIVFDVDGCLTDGSIIYTQNGDEIKSFDVKDGLAISSWIKIGKKAAIITGRNSEIVKRRAKELGIKHIYQGVSDKAKKLQEILEDENADFKNVAIIGDDLNDYKMLKKAALSFTPADGSAYIKEMVDIVLTQKGGKGAVREMIEIILKKEGLEGEFIKLWQ